MYGPIPPVTEAVKVVVSSGHNIGSGVVALTLILPKDTDAEAVSVQPFVSVTVTKYEPVEFTVVDAVLEPVDQA